MAHIKSHLIDSLSMHTLICMYKGCGEYAWKKDQGETERNKIKIDRRRKMERATNDSIRSGDGRHGDVNSGRICAGNNSSNYLSSFDIRRN